ncbi:MAG TPA: hypothetical protein VK474_07185, partial [Chthoniobacterales bacterium]|nr:hypothetical protein [Chthoniobacterales bacterium]
IARAGSDNTKATEAFTRARATIVSQLAKQPDDPNLLATLGLIDAGLGQKEDALSEGRRAVALRPLSEDAVDGAAMLGSLALIYAWSGDTSSALDQLELLAKIPNGPNFGVLKYDPAWDAVRGDPRFAAMLASLQPK